MKEITSDTFINLAKKIEEVNRNLKIKQLIDNIISIKKEIFHNKWDINNYYDKWIQLRNEIDHMSSKQAVSLYDGIASAGSARASTSPFASS